MTFKESDFPSILNFLRNFVKEDSDPAMVKDVVLQIIRLYDDVPLYPGIVSMCLGKMVRTIDARQLAVGTRVHLRTVDRRYHGVVSAVSERGVSLSQVTSSGSESEVKLEFGQIAAATLVNDKVLHELWPALVTARKDLAR